MRWDLPSHLQTWAPSLSAWEADLYGSHEGLPPLLLAFCWLWSVGQQHALGMKKKNREENAVWVFILLVPTLWSQHRLNPSQT